MAIAPDETIWAIDFPPDPIIPNWGSISHYASGHWETIEVFHGNLTMTDIGIDPNGKVWVAAREGLFYSDSKGKTWQKINPPWFRQKAPDIVAMAFSTDGMAWFGFSFIGGGIGGECGLRMPNVEEWGVYRYDGQSWTHFTTDDGLVDNKICDIAIGPDGDVWVGSFDKGISRFDGREWVSYVIPIENP